MAFSTQHFHSAEARPFLRHRPPSESQAANKTQLFEPTRADKYRPLSLAFFFFLRQQSSGAENKKERDVGEKKGGIELLFFFSSMGSWAVGVFGCVNEGTGSVPPQAGVCSSRTCGCLWLHGLSSSTGRFLRCQSKQPVAAVSVLTEPQWHVAPKPQIQLQLDRACLWAPLQDSKVVSDLTDRHPQYKAALTYACWWHRIPALQCWQIILQICNSAGIRFVAPEEFCRGVSWPFELAYCFHRIGAWHAGQDHGKLTPLLCFLLFKINTLQIAQLKAIRFVSPLSELTVN